MSKAIVLLSGGLDSAVTLSVAKSTESEIITLSFNYGQRHQKELIWSRRISGFLGASQHRLIDIPLGSLVKNSSSLIEDSHLSPNQEGSGGGEIPDTWVPQRNMLFLTYAFALADMLDCDRVYTGFNAVDYSGYPDCRPAFVLAAENALNLARKRFVLEGHRIQILTPIIHMRKVDVVRLGLNLHTPFKLTTSCYYGQELACGKCDSCRIRLSAFREVGIPDPIRYA